MVVAVLVYDCNRVNLQLQHQRHAHRTFNRILPLVQLLLQLLQRGAAVVASDARVRHVVDVAWGDGGGLMGVGGCNVVMLGVCWGYEVVMSGVERMMAARVAHLGTATAHPCGRSALQDTSRNHAAWGRRKMEEEGLLSKM